MLTRAGVRQANAEEATKLCNLSEPGLWLPYRTITGTAVADGGQPYGRLRLEHPQAGKKYHQAGGTTVHAYLPPGLEKTVPGGDLCVIEGEFKAMALMEAGFPAVGISGFFGFAIKGGEEMATELAEALDTLKPKRIFFCGDADTALNHQFAVAAVRFAKMVQPLPMVLPRIPLNGPGKGADDCRRELNGTFAAWWQERLSEAMPVNPSTSAATVALGLARREGEALATLTDEGREKAEQKLLEMAVAIEKDPLTQEKLISLAVESMGVGRASFKRGMAAVRLARQAKLAQVGNGNVGSQKVTGKPVNMDLPNGIWPRQVYEVIASETYFYAQNLCRECNGQLLPQSPAEICTFVDQPNRIIPHRVNSKGEIYGVKFTEADGRLLLGAWQDSLPLLRVVEVKSNVPVLAWHNGAPILVNDYCPHTRILARGTPLELPTPAEAVIILSELLRDYDFASLGDLGRAIALLMTPALAQGGFLGSGRAPLFVIEKNEASAGGSLLLRLLCGIYGVSPNPISQLDEPRRMYEDVSSRLLNGDGIIYLDNARGHGLQKLPWLESALTEPNFACRIPYKQGLADVTKRVFAVSTNGALLSGDLTTRTVKIAIRKRPEGYQWHEWPEGGIEEHLAANRSRYLGAIYALVADWAKANRPLGKNLTGFRFPQWERGCAWILQKHFPGLPLLDAEHREAQKRLADPDHDLLRNLFRVVCEGESRGEITATGFAEIAISTGLLEGDKEQHKLNLGKVLKRRFPTDGKHEFDAGRFQVWRDTRLSQSGKEVGFYTITRKEQL